MRDAESDLQMCEAATPGPWRVATNRHPETTGERWGWIQGPREHYCWTDKKAKSRADARFIAEARTALPFWIWESRKWKEHLESAEIALQTMIDECDCNDCPYEPGKYAELVYWRKRAQELKRENEALRDLLNDMYPAVAGRVTVARKECEDENVKMWDDYCRKIIDVLDVDGDSK